MTKRDYEKIAAIIKSRRVWDERPRSKWPASIAAVDEVLDKVALDFAKMAEKDNPRFSVNLFMDACNI